MRDKFYEIKIVKRNQTEMAIVKNSTYEMKT